MSKLKLNSESNVYGKEFEDEVKNFLRDKLKLMDVNGGSSFHIAGPNESNQIDACARYNDILFVFECKAAGRNIKKDFRNDILALKERARIAVRNYKRIPEYRNCNYIVFIFITKRIQISDNNLELLEKTSPKIRYANEHVLEYYSDLYEKIGKFALYNFLADFGVRPSENEKLEVVALRTKLGNYNVYSFFAQPKELLKFSYVARRYATKDAFYQRMLERSRIKKIKQFIDNGGVFPTNIILSLKRGEKEFQSFNNSVFDGISIGKLVIRNSYNACWIIDGQHRLYSHAEPKSNNLIPCLAFDNIEVPEERRFFLEINREQKPIQADLIWDLEGLSQPESERGIISNTVRKLNFCEPFNSKIFIPAYGSRSGKIINMAAFCNGLVNSRLAKSISPNCVGSKNILFSEDCRRMVNRSSRIIAKYFCKIKECFDTEQLKFIFGNAGVPILLYVLEPILARSSKEPDDNSLNNYCDIIKKYFITNYNNLEEMKKLKEETNSEFGRKNIAKQIGLFVRKQTKDNNFWPKMEQFEIVNNIIEMERRLGQLISKRLSELTTNWQKQNIPEPIFKSALKKMEIDGTSFDENFDLADELQIITKKDNWERVFKEIFINKYGFKNLQELEIAFQYLFQSRNPAAHGKSVMISKEDISQCNIYLNKLNRIAPEIIPEFYN